MKYRVFFSSTASTSVVVEADSKESAEDIAWSKVHASLCHHCAHNVELSGDWDLDEAIEED